MRDDLALVARHDRLEHVVPAVSAVHVAGTQSTAFEVAKLVEHEQRVIAGAGVMAIPDAHLLLAVGRAHAGIHVEHDAMGWPSAVHKVDPLARQVGKSSEVVGRREPLRLEAPHLARRSRAPLRRFAADNPAHRRIVRRRSASFTSSYPARRPNTDCRNNPANACRPFLPLRASARTSPAISVKPSTREPRKWSIKRRSKSSPTASDPDSPLGRGMAASPDPGIRCCSLYLNRASRAETQYITLSGECGSLFPP